MQEGTTYSVKKIIIFGIIILILAGLVGFYFMSKKNTPNDENPNGKDLFPFGDGTGQGSTLVQNIGGNVDGEGVPQIEDGVPLGTTNGERLRQITQYPVTNFLSFITNRQILEPKLDEVTGETKLVARTAPIDMIRWNIKQTGILMDAELSEDAIITSQKTVTRIPVAEELWVGNNGNMFGFRTWNSEARSIDTILGTIPTPITLDYCTVPFTQDLKIGSKTSDVKELQRYLNKKLSLNLAIDGSLGPKTFALIKNIQNLLGIEETGNYDTTTKGAINADCAKIVSTFEQENNKPVKLTMSLLAKNISRGAVSPDGSQIFYLVPGQSGVVGVVSNSTGGNQKNIFESPATEWSAQWVNPTTIALTTLASRETNGYLYFLNPTTGDFKKILGPVRGLTTLVSPDARTVLYSVSTDTGLVTKTYSPSTGTVRALDLATLPAKCAWKDAAIVLCGVPRTIPGGQYPDSWYQGIVSFTDVIWRINTVQNNANLILAPDQSFDITKLQVSPTGTYLYFVNKTDQTLWSYRLE